MPLNARCLRNYQAVGLGKRWVGTGRMIVKYLLLYPTEGLQNYASQQIRKQVTPYYHGKGLFSVSIINQSAKQAARC